MIKVLTYCFFILVHSALLLFAIYFAMAVFGRPIGTAYGIMLHFEWLMLSVQGAIAVLLARRVGFGVIVAVLFVTSGAVFVVLVPPHGLATFGFIILAGFFLSLALSFLRRKHLA